MGRNSGQVGEIVPCDPVLPPVPTEPKLFSGNFRHSIDVKNRLTVPKRWRYVGDDSDEAFMMLPHRDGYLLVLPPGRAQQLRQSLPSGGLFDTKMQNALARLIGRATTFGVDSQGRITLLPELMAHAGITKEAVLVGQLDFFKVYSPEAWEAVLKAEADEDLLVLSRL